LYLLGALAASILGFVLPAVLYIKAHEEEYNIALHSSWSSSGVHGSSEESGIELSDRNFATTVNSRMHSDVVDENAPEAVTGTADAEEGEADEGEEEVVSIQFNNKARTMGGVRSALSSAASSPFRNKASSGHAYKGIGENNDSSGSPTNNNREVRERDGSHVSTMQHSSCTAMMPSVVQRWLNSRQWRYFMGFRQFHLAFFMIFFGFVALIVGVSTVLVDVA
jgi:hypothetical protein